MRYLGSCLLVVAISLQAITVWSDDRTARLGFVTVSVSPPSVSIDPFWARLRELGWAEGRNLIVEARSAEGHYDRLPAIMKELVDRKVDIIVTSSTPAGFAAKNATSTVPIVNSGMFDPVRDGLVASLAHPGGNLTGLSWGFSQGLGGKLLELLQETVPRLSTVAFIMNPDNPADRATVKEVASAAEIRHLKLVVIQARNADSLQRALEKARRQGQALLVLGDPFLYSQRRDITRFANQNHLPALYGMREFVEGGGMMAYALNRAAAWRRTAEYVDQILRGANPGELPIEQPTQYLLTVNTKVANALGITIPESILLRADEVLP